MWKTNAVSTRASQLLVVPMQVVDLLQNGMPLRYDDLSASQAFLRAAAAVNDLTTDLHKHHGAVRDFMRELLSSVCLDPPESLLCISLTLPAGWASFAWISYACLLHYQGSWLCIECL